MCGVLLRLCKHGGYMVHHHMILHFIRIDSYHISSINLPRMEGVLSPHTFLARSVSLSGQPDTYY